MRNNLFSWFFDRDVRTGDNPALSPLERLFIKKISQFFTAGTSVLAKQEIDIGDEVRTFSFLIKSANGKAIGVEFVVGEYDLKRKVAPGDEKLAVSCQLDSMYRFTGPEITPFLKDCIFLIMRFDPDLFKSDLISSGSSVFSMAMVQTLTYKMIFENSDISYRQSLIVERRTKNPPWPENISSAGLSEKPRNQEDSIISDDPEKTATPVEPEKPFDFVAVLEEFMEKSKIKPNWRYPLSDTLFSSVYCDESDKILSTFKRADSEDPNGFFPQKEVLYALEGEKEGRFPKGLYLYYKQIEMNRELAKQQKLAIANDITQNVPGFSPGWLALASLVPETEYQLAAIEQGLLTNPDQHTKGLMLQRKAYALSVLGRNNESIKTLRELIRAPERTSVY